MTIPQPLQRAHRGHACPPLVGMASIKMYDKFGHILRIETTAKDVSFFKH